ncbi:MAG: alpha/beta-type small acid-soluble spore protein [Bacillota bacterium]|nr:alpha/beta-type small acid-soluble spore protein [Bacillota bacterium]
MPRRRRIVLPEARRGLDRLKYEVARDLGLADDVERRGWGDMTTREVGHIGGQMVRRMVRYAEENMARKGEGGQREERQGG